MRILHYVFYALASLCTTLLSASSPVASPSSVAGDVLSVHEKKASPVPVVIGFGVSSCSSSSPPSSVLAGCGACSQPPSLLSISPILQLDEGQKGAVPAGTGRASATSLLRLLLSRFCPWHRNDTASCAAMVPSSLAYGGPRPVRHTLLVRNIGCCGSVVHRLSLSLFLL